MKRILLTLIISLVFLVPCSGYYIHNHEFTELVARLSNAETKADDYKCFAELYPERAKQAQIPTLGEIVTRNGKKYRVIAEADHPEVDQWVHWMDVEPLDGVCTYAISFKFRPDGSLSFKVWECEKITEIIKQYCEKEGRNIDDMKHYAEPPGLDLKNAI